MSSTKTTSTPVDMFLLALFELVSLVSESMISHIHLLLPLIIGCIPFLLHGLVSICYLVKLPYIPIRYIH
jgi:hypothetical protein